MHRIGVSASRFLGVASAVVVLMVVGCAGGPSPTTLNTGVGVDPVARAESRGQGVKTVQVAVAPAVSSNVILVANKNAPPAATEPTVEPAEDPFYDPFAKSDEPAGGEEYDPWGAPQTERVRIRRASGPRGPQPACAGENAVVPNPVQIGISNLFYNIRFPSRLINNLAQGKLSGAGTEVGRFLLNSTFGLGGLVDVAKYMDITTPEEDTGQTLGYYGVKPGPYLVVPFLPPFTVRDFFGYIGDIALNPINWMVFPLIEVNGVPSLVAHHNRTTSSIAQIGGRVEEILNDRSLNLEKFQGVEEATLDLYTAVKNAYIQKRRNAIRE